MDRGRLPVGSGISIHPSSWGEKVPGVKSLGMRLAVEWAGLGFVELDLWAVSGQCLDG